MKRVFAAMMMVFAVGAAAHAGEAEGKAAAYRAALRWLTVWDGGNLDAGWRSASSHFKHDVSSSDARRVYEAMRRPLGALKERKVASSEFNRAPDGDYWDFVFASEYAQRRGATETIEMVREPDGTWKVASWGVR